MKSNNLASVNYYYTGEQPIFDMLSTGQRKFSKEKERTMSAWSFLFTSPLRNSETSSSLYLSDVIEWASFGKGLFLVFLANIYPWKALPKRM